MSLSPCKQLIVGKNAIPNSFQYLSVGVMNILFPVCQHDLLIELLIWNIPTAANPIKKIAAHPSEICIKPTGAIHSVEYATEFNSIILCVICMKFVK